MSICSETGHEWFFTIDITERYCYACRRCDVSLSEAKYEQLGAAAKYYGIDPDKGKGLYGKYTVIRNDGSSSEGGKHENCRYFVLDLTHDQYAIDALGAYALACENEYPLLAKDLRSIIIKMQIPKE